MLNPEQIAKQLTDLEQSSQTKSSEESNLALQEYQLSLKYLEEAKLSNNCLSNDYPSKNNNTQTSNIPETLRFETLNPEALNRAAGYLESAASLGYAKAQHEIARFYEEGIAVNRNIKLALAWYERSARQGLVDAQYALALCLLRSPSLQTLPIAAGWMELASRNRHVPAEIRLRNLLKERPNLKIIQPDFGDQSIHRKLVSITTLLDATPREGKAHPESQHDLILKAKKAGYSVKLEVLPIACERMAFSNQVLAKNEHLFSLQHWDPYLRQKITISKIRKGDTSMILAVPARANTQVKFGFGTPANSSDFSIETLEQDTHILIQVPAGTSVSEIRQAGKIHLQNDNTQTLHLMQVHSAKNISIEASKIQYDEKTFYVSGKLELNFKSPQDISTAILNPGPLSIQFKTPEISNTTSKVSNTPATTTAATSPPMPIYAPIRILANITAGLPDSKEQADFVCSSDQHALHIGSEMGSYIKIASTGKATLAVQNFDLVKGKVVGYQGVQIRSQNAIRVGRLIPASPSTQSLASTKPVTSTKPPASAKPAVSSKSEISLVLNTPSSIIGGTEVLLCSNNQIILEGSEIHAENGIEFQAPEMLDHIAGKITTNGDAVFKTPKVKHRLLAQIDTQNRRENYPCANIYNSIKEYHCISKALSGPAYMRVGKLLIVNDLEILGSQIQHGGFKGSCSKIEDFVSYTSWTHHMFCGHKYYNQCQWHQSKKHDVHHIEKAIFSSGTALVLSQKQIDLTGIIFAPQFTLSHFNQANLGIQSIDLALPEPKKFKPILQLPILSSARFEYLGPHANPNTNSNANPNANPTADVPDVLFRSVLPLPCQSPRPPLIIINKDGSLSQSPSHKSSLFPTEMEEESLVETLLRECGFGILDKKTHEPKAMVYRLLANAWKVFGTGRATACLDHQHNPKWYAALKVPILVYKEINFDNQFRLWPHLIIPLSWDNPKFRDWAGGIFCRSGDIQIQGKDRQHSKLSITAHLDAKGMICFSRLKTLKQEKRLCIQNHTVVETTTTESFAGLNRKTQDNIKTMTVVIPQPGATVTASSGVVYQDIESVHLQAAEIRAGKNGVLASNINSITEKAAISSQLVHEFCSAESYLHSIEQYRVRTENTIIPTRITTTGQIYLQANDQHYDSANLHATQNIQLDAQTRLKLGATIVTEALPTRMRAGDFSIQLSSGTITKGTPVKLISTAGDIICRSGGTLHAIGTQMLAQNIKQESEKQMIVEPLRLKEQYQSHSEGLRGFSYYQQDSSQNREAGIPAHFLAKGSIELVSKTKNLVLVAPQFLAGKEIKFSTPKGTTIIRPAVFYQDISVSELSMGLSFFGSQTIEAAMKRDFREAAFNLLREFPLLASLEQLSQSKNKDTSDHIADGMQTLYQAYKTYKAFSQSKNLKEFLKSQISLDPKICISSSKSEHEWTELALPWLQAKSIIIEARNLSCKGTQAIAEKLTVKVDESMSFEAAEQQTRSSTSHTAVSLGCQSENSLPNLGLKIEESEQRSLEFITSRFNISGLTCLYAGDQISLSGVYLETLQAVLVAERLALKTLQDTMQGKSVSVQVSTEGSIAMAISDQNKKLTKEQTEIRAKETLLANVEKTIHMLGSKITLEGAAKPLKAQLPNGKQIDFYALKLPKEVFLLFFRLNVEMFRTLMGSPLGNSPHPNPLSYLNMEVLNLIAKLKGIQIHVWAENTKGLLEILSSTAVPPLEVQSSKQILNLYYSSSEKIWAVLNLQPGRIDTKEVLGTSVIDQQHQNAFSFSFSTCLIDTNFLVSAATGVTTNATSSSISAITGIGNINVSLNEQERINRPCIAANITLMADKIQGITRDLSKAQETTMDEHHHIRAFLPLGNPTAIAQEMRQTFTRPPLMFQSVNQNSSSKESINHL